MILNCKSVFTANAGAVQEASNTSEEEPVATTSTAEATAEASAKVETAVQAKEEDESESTPAKGSEDADTGVLQIYMDDAEIRDDDIGGSAKKDLGGAGDGNVKTKNVSAGDKKEAEVVEKACSSHTWQGEDRRLGFRRVADRTNQMSAVRQDVQG